MSKCFKKERNREGRELNSREEKTRKEDGIEKYLFKVLARIMLPSTISKKLRQFK